MNLLMSLVLACEKLKSTARVKSPRDKYLFAKESSIAMKATNIGTKMRTVPRRISCGLTSIFFICGELKT